MGDKYEIIDRNGYLLVKGSVAITVVGDADIRVENDCNLDVVGDMSTKVAGNYRLSVQKDIQIKANGKFEMETLLDTILQAQNIRLNCDTPVDIPILEQKAEGRTGQSPSGQARIRELVCSEVQRSCASQRRQVA